MADSANEATALNVQWGQDDAVTLRQFLKDHPRILTALWQARGTIKVGNQSSADEIAGYERCFNALKGMAADLPHTDENHEVDIEED